MSASVRKGSWAPGELDTLRRLYGTLSTERLARILHRDLEAVVQRARALFGGARQRGTWSAEEEQRFTLMIGILAPDEMALVLGRARGEVRGRLEERSRATRRGSWAPAEIGLLKRIFGSRPDPAVALALRRSLRSVRQQARKLCLSKDKEFAARHGSGASMPRWSEAEVAALSHYYPDRSNLELARMLGRSARSILAKASHLGLTKSPRLRARIGRENAALRSASRRGD